MFIDVSRTISPESVAYPGNRPLRFVQHGKLGVDSDFTEIWLEGFSGHVMTHVDMPCHVIDGGKSLDDYEVSDFIFDAVVHEVPGDVINRDLIEGLPDVRGKAVLFKTRGSQLNDTDPFSQNYVYIDASGADALCEKGVAAVGIDYLSIDYLSIDLKEDSVAHTTLLGNEILIFEAMQLRDAEPGEFKLYAFPLKIKGGDGSCVRAVLQTV